MDDKIRINKYLSQKGICSRREADKLIEERRVKINGEIASNGTKINEYDEVMLDGNLINVNVDKIVLAYNKPIGITCTHKDVHADKTVFDDIAYPSILNYAGRLDKDSHGLLLLTNDGDLINRLMRSKNEHEKEYVVNVNKPITKDFIDKIQGNVYLKELDLTTKKCKAWKIEKNVFGIILKQGLNRQIRRMCSEFGYNVTDLKRVRVKNILLGQVKEGKYRVIEGKELETLYEGLDE